MCYIRGGGAISQVRQSLVRASCVPNDAAKAMARHTGHIGPQKHREDRKGEGTKGLDDLKCCNSWTMDAEMAFTNRATYLLATGYTGPQNTSKEGFQHMGM